MLTSGRAKLLTRTFLMKKAQETLAEYGSEVSKVLNEIEELAKTGHKGKAIETPHPKEVAEVLKYYLEYEDANVSPDGKYVIVKWFDK